MKNQRRTLRSRVTLESEGQRLDLYLAEAYPDQSRGYWKKVVDIGGVHLDQRRMSRCSREVRAGEQVEVYIDGMELDKWVLKEQHVLYQDRYLLALNKPVGIDTQPTPSRFKGTLYQGVLDHLGRAKGHGKKVDVGMVQRLDRDTSGVIVFSIHPQAHRGLTRQFHERRVQKTYRALVSGTLQGEGEFHSSLAKVRATNLVRSVAKGGKEARTRYRVLAQGDGCTLVEVEPITGRSHQIRVHFSEAGHPLVGDVRYGGPNGIAGLEVAAHMLHAQQLLLNHPVTAASLQLSAQRPDIWQQVSSRVGLENLP